MAWQQRGHNWWGDGWQSSSWDWNWNSRSQQQPATPTKKTRYAEDLASPQGHKQQDYSFPATSQQKPGYHDNEEVYGLKFPSKILPTAWATQHSLAGRDVREVGIYDLCYKGLDNYHLRSFANGRYLNVVFARSIKESIFMQSMLTAIREAKMNIDQIAAVYCKQHNKPIEKSQAEAKIKKMQTQALGEWMAQQLRHVPHQQAQVNTKQQQPTTDKEKQANSASPHAEKAAETDLLAQALTLAFDSTSVARTLTTQSPA